MEHIRKDWIIGEPLGFILDFGWYFPKIFAFNFYYCVVKAYYYNKIKFKQIMLILCVLLPWRLLIKLITGFSYISIKMAALCTSEIINSYGSEWNLSEFYSEFVKGFIANISENYFFDLLFDVKLYRIYIYIKIILIKLFLIRLDTKLSIKIPLL